MTGNTVIFVTDKRQSNLAAFLPGKKQTLDWRRGIRQEEAGVLMDSRYLVLPIPVTKIGKNQDVDELLKEYLTKGCGKNWTLYGGIFGPEWRQRCEDAEVEYYDLMKDATVVHRNACITAEATVAEILKYSDYVIREQKVIVCGYSRPGGTDLIAAEAYGIKVVAALGLPGIYTTKSSAKVLADAILEHGKIGRERKEEKEWVYQIVI